MTDEKDATWWRGSWPVVGPTPLGPDWGWGSRAIEIATLPLSAVFFLVVGVHRATGWVLAKVFSPGQVRE